MLKQLFEIKLWSELVTDINCAKCKNPVNETHVIHISVLKSDFWLSDIDYARWGYFYHPTCAKEIIETISSLFPDFGPIPNLLLTEDINVKSTI